MLILQKNNVIQFVIQLLHIRVLTMVVYRIQMVDIQLWLIVKKIVDISVIILQDLVKEILLVNLLNYLIVTLIVISGYGNVLLILGIVFNRQTVLFLHRLYANNLVMLDVIGMLEV
jgi:hypothetical protein